jgi:hypothetical protein
MEGQRFFDLSRYDNGTGSMAATLNAYVAVEKREAHFTWLITLPYLQKGLMNILPYPRKKLMRKIQPVQFI